MDETKSINNQKSVDSMTIKRIAYDQWRFKAIQTTISIIKHLAYNSSVGPAIDNHEKLGVFQERNAADAGSSPCGLDRSRAVCARSTIC